MTTRWNYEIEGSDADKEQWVLKGTWTGDYSDVWTEVHREIFHSLTAGNAVYGHPGIGCRGPYQIKRVTIERKAG